MTMSELLLPEFDQEMATTRRVLARVPDDRADWRPHAKSFPLAHLAQLVATMPGWIASTLRQTGIDLAASPGYGVHTVDSLLAQFDRLVADARDGLAASKEADYAVPWSLRNGTNVLFTAPRGAAVRMHLNHHVHHRAQLALYLRLLDVPVPSMYGPTADEPWGAGAAG